MFLFLKYNSGHSTPNKSTITSFYANRKFETNILKNSLTVILFHGKMWETTGRNFEKFLVQATLISKQKSFALKKFLPFKTSIKNNFFSNT